MIKLKSLLILEKLSVSDADQILTKFGISNASAIDKDTLAGLIKQLAKKYHPDLGGDTYSMQQINTAWDTIKDAPQYTNPLQDFPSTEPRQNYQDANYVKWKAWDISGRPEQTPEHKYMFWNWDGSCFRGSLDIYAVPEKLFEISNMLSMWDNHNRSVAVFVSQDKEENAIYLVKLMGKEITPPKRFEHNSFNKNPSNDQQFCRKLRRILTPDV